MEGLGFSINENLKYEVLVVIIPTCCVPRLPPGGSERYWLSFVFLLLFLDTGCVHLISLMWLEDVIASSSSSVAEPVLRGPTHSFTGDKVSQ